MKAKYTLGQWQLKSHPFLHIESDEQWICQLSDIREDRSIRILTDEWEAETLRVSEIKVANAKLIAAAPELLKACIESLSALKNGYIEDRANATKLILDAIKKATD